MAVETVVFDVSNTLVNLQTGQAAPGVVDAVNRLRSQGVGIVAIGNHASHDLTATLRRAGVPVDHVIGWDLTGKPKGSPEWGTHMLRITGLRPNQLLLIGDERLDMVTATRDGIVYAHAAWAAPPGQYGQYGLVAPSPGWVPAIVEHIFRKRYPWYWRFDARDGAGRRVQAHTLIEAGGDYSDNMRVALLRLLKDEIDSSVGPMLLSEFVMLHMLASVYEANLFGGVDYWTIYPGHDGKPNAIMGDFLGVATKLFRQRYVGDLFERHREARRSRDAWSRGREFGARQNQLETMRMSGKYRGKLAGKRVLVIDNFLTRGYSTEAARNVLLAAGCAEVITACVGKYGQWMHTISPPPGASWDPFTTVPPDAAMFADLELPGTYVQDAMTEFRASYAGIGASTW